MHRHNITTNYGSVPTQDSRDPITTSHEEKENMEKVADPRETTPALLEYARTPMWSSPPTTIRETDFVRQHHTTHDLYEERTRSWCFWTGLAYWIVILCDGTAELGVRRRFINYDSHMDTATKIRHNPDTFRRQIILEVVACLADTIVAVSLSGLLISLSMGTNSRSSSTTTLPPPDDSSPLPIIGAGIFRFLQQTIRMGNVLLLMAICLLLDETFHPVMPVASAINNTDRNSQDVAAKWAFFYVTLHSYGQVLAQMWLGISLTTWGWCALAIHLQHNSMDNNDTTTTTTNSKNSMIPQWIITLLILAGVGYLFDGIGFFWLSNYPIIPFSTSSAPASVSFSSYTTSTSAFSMQVSSISSHGWIRMLATLLGECTLAGWLVVRALTGAPKPRSLAPQQQDP